MPSRRQFLELSGLAGLAAASAACGRDASLARLFGVSKETASRGPRPLRDARTDAANRLLNRLTYGGRPGDLELVRDIGPGAFIEEQLSPASITDTEAFWKVRRVETANMDLPDIFDVAAPTAVSDLRRATILRALYSRRQLYERMVEFWTDHLNIYVGKGDCAWLKTVDDREVIRRHALGRFGDLLAASARSPAMLTYLDGRASSRGKTNENYARELLELHTLGVDGGYTQRDVMELSRALTGWRLRSVWHRGKAFFDPAAHDEGSKQVLGMRLGPGSSGDIDQVIDRLCAHPSTARFIATKLCRRFVADDPPPALIGQTAAAFSQSGGDIRATLSTLLHSDELQNAPPLFKRPYTYAISALRALRARTDAGPALQHQLAALGQLPFGWPTPDGYPDGDAHWSARMLPRWNFALALANNQIAGTKVDLEPEIAASDLAADLVGREWTSAEKQALPNADSREQTVALALCHPRFQYA